MPTRLLLAAFAATWFAPVLARETTDAFKAGDVKLGESMAARDCVACHARRFDGDNDHMYVRPDRKVRSAAQLREQIRNCNIELGSGYSPDEEEHLAAYLNQRYYHFH